MSRSPQNPLVLTSGTALDSVQVEFETYGELNAQRNNAILITHALSGDAHVAGWDATALEQGRAWRQRKPGWWIRLSDQARPSTPIAGL